MDPCLPTAPELAQHLGGPLPWQTLREYLLYVEGKGSSQNIASLIGATTLRIHGAGYDDRPMTAAELDRVTGLVADEMADGAMGIGSALIYPPGFYASTEERSRSRRSPVGTAARTSRTCAARRSLEGPSRAAAHLA